MLEKSLRKIQKLIPKNVYKFFQPIYHFSLAVLGAVIYRFPGKKIHVIAITGTKGKSSTAEFLNAILEADGNINDYKTALLSTIRFKIGDDSHANMFKMTMPGRFFVQKFLYQAVKANCKYIVIEMTSEGARCYRHMFTYPDALLFTNLSPEHIESHGGFKNYKACKLRIAKAVEKSGKEDTTIVANVSNEYGKEFLDFKVNNKIEYTEEESKDVRLSVDGNFNKLNALAAKKYALRLGIEEEIMNKALFDLKVIPGRVQHIRLDDNNENKTNNKSSTKKQDFEVIVDYAHTEDSLEKLYKTYADNYVIGVLGACGGGRDKGKREALGNTAHEHCNEVIVTDEDPYDDNPREIMESVMRGVLQNVKIIGNQKDLEEKYIIIEDRRAAINYAITRAEKYINNLPQDIIKASNIIPKKPIVIVSGKGTDPCIMRANGMREKWSDANVAREELGKALNN